MGGALELDCDFSAAFGEAFAGANVERNIGPTPVLDEEFQRDIGFRYRVGCNSLLISITNHGLSVDHPGYVLSAYCVVYYLFRCEHGYSTHDFDLLITDGVGIICDGWFHGRKAKHLHDVVLYYVANGTRLIVIFGACADA